MVTPELINYIKLQVRKDISKETIFSKLLGVGWDKADIEESFKKIEDEIKIALTSVHDPYREPIGNEEPRTIKKIFTPGVNNSEVSKVWPQAETQPKIEPKIKQPKAEINKEGLGAEFMPTLKLKETVTPTTTLDGSINRPLREMRSMNKDLNEQKELKKNVPTKTLKKHKKLIAFVIAIFILGVLTGGGYFAYKKGYVDNVISVIPFDIPFFKLSPEQAMRKIIIATVGIKSGSLNGYISIDSVSTKVIAEEVVLDNEDSPTINSKSEVRYEDYAIHNILTVENNFDINDTNNQKFYQKVTLNSNLGEWFYSKGLDESVEFIFIDKILYLQIPQLSFLIPEELLTSGTWVSVNGDNLNKLKSENTELLIERNINEEDIEALTQKRKEFIEFIKNFKFIDGITEIGLEDFDGIQSRHYQMIMTKNSLKNFISQVANIFADEISENIKYVDSNLESLEDINIDIWVNKKSYEPIKVLIKTRTNDLYTNSMVKEISDLEILIKLSNINQPVDIKVPEKVKSVYDIWHDFMGYSLDKQTMISEESPALDDNGEDQPLN